MANPIDAVISACAMNSQGFLSLEFNPTGLSLNTFGFITPCDALWTPADPVVSTTWVDAVTSTITTETCID